MSGLRTEIDSSLARRLVASQFPGWSHLPVAPVPASGWDNRTFRLGEDMVVRLPSARRYAAQVEKEREWLPRLAPLLPLKIPEPLAAGEPAEGYPWRWSVYRWIPGETAAASPACASDARFGAGLAHFLVALHRIDAAGGPPPGVHNFHRGGALAHYDGEAREAIRRLGGTPEAAACAALWEAALATAWRREPLWVHGDFAPENLLVRDGRLAAVIDWGGAAVGDPACDLTIAWTCLAGEGREAFRSALPFDPGTWARARGWALWKALILATGLVEGPAAQVQGAPLVLDRLLEDGAASAAAAKRPG